VHAKNAHAKSTKGFFFLPHDARGIHLPAMMPKMHVRAKYSAIFSFFLPHVTVEKGYLSFGFQDTPSVLKYKMF
jgi:hypothetical protein